MSKPTGSEPRKAVLLRLGAQHDPFVSVERKAWRNGKKTGPGVRAGSPSAVAKYKLDRGLRFTDRHHLADEAGTSCS